MVTSSIVESARQIFLCCLSLCYGVAFTSYYIQIPGLFGRNGVLPAHHWINRGGPKSNYDRFATSPNALYLLNGTGLSVEEGLILLCLIGTAMAVFSFSTRLMRGSLAYVVMWFCYHSLYDAGRTFLSFQWDILLLETGFLAILVAPLNFPSRMVVRLKRHDEILMFSVRFLLFKLMFMSGVVKLQSRCPTWWGLTATTYHYETQCIPTPLAWFAHSLIPYWVHKLSVVGVYLVEIILPFYLFSPIKCQRKMAVYSIMFLMLTIILSGNYNFFNFLTIALCLGSLEDSDYPSFMHSYDKTHIDTAKNVCKQSSTCKLFTRGIDWFMNIGLLYWTIRLFNLRFNFSTFEVDSSIAFSFESFQTFVNVAVVAAIFLSSVNLFWIVMKNLFCAAFEEQGMFGKMWSSSQTILFGVVACLLLSVQMIPLTELTNKESEDLVPSFAQSLHIRFYHSHVSHGYGLFRRMTGVGGRPEIIIQGGDSAKGPWTDLHFQYKPGNLSAPPPWVAPHQPRLDWQMWFAALSTPQFTPWYNTLLFRILTGQPEVLALLDEKANSKFLSKPPKFVRGIKYKYYFTKGAGTANWWRRVDEPPLYSDPVSLTSPALLSHMQQHNIKTAPPLKPDESWGTLRRLMFQLRPGGDFKVPGEALCWSVLLPCVAMKLGKIFTPKYDIKLFYLQ